MRKIVRFATLIALLGSLGLAACHRHTYSVGSGGDVHRSPAYRRWQSHWLFGVIGETKLDIEKVCPSGNATVRDEHSLLNSVVAAFIGAVWWPTTVTIYCGDNQPKQASIAFTPDELRRLAQDPRVLARARQWCSARPEGACSAE